MVNIGIVITKTDLARTFSIFSQKISEYLDDPNTLFLFSDESPLIARYLHKLRYRKCLVYHIGERPKHTIGKFQNKGGYLSYPEIYATIREDSSVVIDASLE